MGWIESLQRCCMNISSNTIITCWVLHLGNLYLPLSLALVVVVEIGLPLRVNSMSSTNTSVLDANLGSLDDICNEFWLTLIIVSLPQLKYLVGLVKLYLPSESVLAVWRSLPWPSVRVILSPGKAYYLQNL